MEARTLTLKAGESHEARFGLDSMQVAGAPDGQPALAVRPVANGS